MANILLAARGSHPPPTVGKNWPSTFINRHPKSIQAWFTTVQQVIDKNGIQPEDIYNFDETGFAMGLISAQKVVTRQECYGRRSILQPGNREWVTAIEAICADGYSLPPCVIFKEKVAIASWFDNLPKDWRFEISANGWTTDQIGLRGLEELFIPSTSSRVRGRFRLLILDGHGSHLTPQFDRICSENNIIPLCMPPHSSHLLRPLDVGCFAVLKRTYGRFISDLARTGYNHIDKLDFLADFQRARVEAFRPKTIQNSFLATGLVCSRPSSRSSQFTSKTPRTVVQLQKQASTLKDLLKQRSNSPPSPSKLMLDQIIKGHCISLRNTALLAQENANLRATNEKKRQKRSRSARQIPCEEGWNVEKGLQLLTQVDLPVEAPMVESHTQVELPVQPNQPAPRAQPRCSGCREVGHKINVCRQSIWRLLRESNLWKWLVLQRPELKPEHVAKRLQWALRVRDYTPEKWKKVFWSDESTVERGKGSRREHTFTRPKDQIALRDIQEVSYKGVKQMFWAAFSGSRRHTGLIPLSGDPDSPRGGVN
ncbi:uncharacterized protein N7483_002423 [Penicillium malachiteum]|uniref:uncharacterized protein n=1 Tax=Penicillium malachiteum TaxID=1324776 RepID=UPI002547FE86|nr:uncharacterized protein N7483_002423 [Penicillium malachiteum]KAJ5737298.1 hypothetical protein N7483_002423 [Penicillium malachiteum]